MKLLLCPRCSDVRKLGYEVTTCECGYVRARYESDGWHATHNGNGYLLGMNNHSLGRALGDYAHAASIDRSLVNQEPSPFVFDAWVMTGNPRVSIKEDL